MTVKIEVNEDGWNLDNSYAKLPKTWFTHVNPTPVASPQLIILNEDLARSLGLHIAKLSSLEGVAMLAGNTIPDGAMPLAQAYAGHQFGHFTMLGDGRAHLIGEQLTPSGERLDIQLKGSGRTPYSRSGDGRAAVGPMLREYIISEAMHGLGIPTTRSLAVVKSEESIYRETQQPGAILTRVAASHIRVGTFQFVANQGDKEDVSILADYVLERHYPELLGNEDNRYLSLLHGVIKRQAELIAKWQLVGFIHGVMNTDNMAISGETIDYGPCAFMDTYNPATVFSSIDARGRYAYGNQPQIAMWNLARFAETLLPLLHDDEEKAVSMAENAITEFAIIFEDHWIRGMRAKLGIYNEEEQDKALMDGLLGLMLNYKADYTNTFRALTTGKLEHIDLFGSAGFAKWREQWEARLERQPESRDTSRELMKNSNPAVIPRNHRVEAALEAAVKFDDYSVMEQLLAVVKTPYAHSLEQDPYTTLPEACDRPYQTFCGT